MLLPNQSIMAYDEARFTSDFSKYLRKLPQEHPLRVSCAIEYKIKKHDKRINFKSDFQPQQIPSLVKANTSCVYKKISDMEVSIKPFDAFQLCNVPAYVIICWYAPHQYKRVHVIPVHNITMFMDQGKKSINQEEADQLSTLSFLL